MSIPDTPPIWKSLPTKLRAYEAVYWLNRSFEAALLSLERLEQVGMFRLEYLNECKIRLELTRAETNEELIDTLHEQEMEDAAQFDRMDRDWKNRIKDPDDVFLAAAKRKQEIKEQMKDLQRGLDRLKPNRKRKRPRRKTRQSR